MTLLEQIEIAEAELLKKLNELVQDHAILTGLEVATVEVNLSLHQPLSSKKSIVVGRRLKLTYHPRN